MIGCNPAPNLHRNPRPGANARGHYVGEEDLLVTYRNPTLDSVTWAIAAVGALSWGFRGLFGFDLVRSFFGEDTFATRFVYTLVGIAGIWSFYNWLNKATTPEPAPNPLSRLFGERW
jgi:uncharacterized membrane protein YuzA (DUF378 family)